MDRRKGEVKNDEWHLVFCFAEKDHAEKFKARFAGEWLDPATRGMGSRWHLLREPSRNFIEGRRLRMTEAGGA
jgi:hypothetical protein